MSQSPESAVETLQMPQVSLYIREGGKNRVPLSQDAVLRASGEGRTNRTGQAGPGKTSEYYRLFNQFRTE